MTDGEPGPPRESSPGDVSPSVGIGSELRRFLRLLRRRWAYVALPPLAVGVVALVTSLSAAPVYEARARVALPDPGDLTQGTAGRLALTDQELATQVQVLRSRFVARRVINELGLDVQPRSLLGRVGAQRLGDSRVLSIGTRSPDPQRAAELAQTFAREFLAYRREQALQRLETVSQGLRQRAEQLRQRLASLDEQGGGAGLQAQRNRLSGQLARMETQLAALQAPESFLEARGEIILNAAVPTQPVQPQPFQRTTAGVLLGLAVGVGLAFGREWLDDRVRAERDVAAATDGRPVLAVVPDWGVDGPGALPVVEEPFSAAAEAFRTLRTNLATAAGGGGGSLLVAGAEEGTGKTTVALNLAVAAAQAGSEVTLVEADLRRPTVGAMLGGTESDGLAAVLSGEASRDEVALELRPSGVSLLLAGERPDNPSELLASERMHELTVTLRGDNDLVVYDVPPLLAVADGLGLADRVERTVLVVGAGTSTRESLGQVADRLARSDGALLGSVVNRAGPSVWEGHPADGGSYGSAGRSRGWWPSWLARIRAFLPEARA